jgi:putative hydrolase of the HAD superfamily
MKYKAVVFDLFGTLVGGYSRGDYDRTISHMAEVLSLPRDAFARMWRETGRVRTKDHLATPRAAIEHISRNLGGPLEPRAVGEAAEMRLDFLRRCLTVRRDAVETVAHLREAALKIGLISNCSPEVPGLWREVPLAPLVDVALFSSDEGLRKPDARIYLLACERLGVEPRNCLYVGDGADGELPGASQVGMRALRVQVEKEDYFGDDSAEKWQGPAIPALKELMSHVGS